MDSDSAVLIAAIAADREAMAKRLEALNDAVQRPQWETDAAVSDHVGTCIHHWYGGAEGILERLCRAFEGKLPAGDRWHNQLLDQMALDLGATRGPVIAGETRDALRKVLAFRHFFRHAYAAEWEPELLEMAVGNLRRAADLFDRDIDGFLGKF